MRYGRFETYENFLRELELFHGKPAPGGVVGLQMVNLAWELLPEGILMDVICETRKCLADAVQLLTPCTVGNHWLRIVDTGKFAAIFYDKVTGEGVRIDLSMEKLPKWPRVEEWFFKLIPKREQDLYAILEEINRAGSDLFDCREVLMEEKLLKVRPKEPPVICSLCSEAYPPSHGAVCRGCSGKTEKLYHIKKNVVLQR